MMRLTLKAQLTELTADHEKLQANEISKLNPLASYCIVLPHAFLSLVRCEQIETLPYGCGILRVETKVLDSKFHSMTPTSEQQMK
jgi:hypothetical protein